MKVRDGKASCRLAMLELRYCRVRILPPRTKQESYPALTLTMLHAIERNTPQDVESIDWKLITDLPVTISVQAIEKLSCTGRSRSFKKS
jgi:hypothetical protein